MCGIVYMQSFNGLPVNQMVWDQYQSQKSRGQEGFGVFNGNHTVKAAMEKRMKRWMRKPKNETDMMLFHHRFPTSTVNTKRAAHPFNTGDYFGDTKYVLVHNGTIDNDFQMKAAHEKLGIEYQSVLEDGTFNDSESLLWDFALMAEGKQKDMEAFGGIAFICIKLVKNVPERMFFARNYSRPLKLKRDAEGIMLSSEGEGEEVKVNRLFNYNYALKRLSQRYLNVKSYDPKWSNSTYKAPISNERWNSRSEYYPQRYSTARNNMCAPYDEFEDSEDYYLDDYGYTWYGEEATQYRKIDTRIANAVNAGRYEEDDYDFDYETKNSDGTWETVKAKIRSVSNRNVNQISTNPQLIGTIITGRAPTQDEINVRVFKEIGNAQGSYDVAYWHLYGMKQIMEEDIKRVSYSSYQERTELRLIQACLENIEFDDDNYGDGALHPMWRTNSEQQILLGV